MPDTPLDKLEIQITSSSEGAEKKVNALADALERLSNMSSLKGIEGVAKKITALGDASQKIAVTVDPSSDKAIDGIIDKVSVLQRAIEKVNATAINIPSLSKQTGGTSKTTAQTVRAYASISGTGEAASGQAEGEKVRENVSALNNVKKSAEEASASIKKMRKSMSDQWSTWSSLKGMVHGVGEAIKNTFAKAAESSEKFAKVLRGVIPVVGVITTVLRGIWKIGGGIFSIFKKVASTIAGGFVGGVKKLASGLKSIGSHVLNYITKPFTRAIAVIQKWKAALVRVAFYRLVRTAIKMVTDGFKEGIENLYYFSSLTESQFKPAMDSLASSSLYLKNSLGAMAAPLIQAVAPAVNYLIDLFVSLLNVINMVFSVLGGRTYTKALKTSAKYADDLDKSLGGGASSAKELQRYLIGIDQLTIMPDEPNSGGGGGGGLDLGSQYEDMFEEVPLPDWVLNIKDAINAGDWTGAGELLAEKVNSLIDKLKKNAKTWGRNIGKAIQNGIELSLGFIRKVDVEGVGESITTLIGNALNEIRGEDLGAIIASGIKSAFRFAHGLLKGYNGPEIGTYLANVVNGWFAELRRDSGWKKAGQDINTAILSIINGVTNFLKNLNTDGIEKDLKDFFGEIKWDDIWMSLERLAETAANKVPWQDMLNGLWRFAANVLVFLRRNVLNIPDSQASQTWQSLQAKLANASARINWADIISGLIAFVSDLTTTIKNAIPEGGWDTIWTSIKENIAGALGFDDWEDLKTQFQEKVFNVISEALKAAGDSIYESLSAAHPVWASLLFPKREEINRYSHTFINMAGECGYDFANRWLETLVSTGKISGEEAAKIAKNAAEGLSNNSRLVTGAAETISNGVNNAFSKIDKNIDVNLDATKTPQYETTTRQLQDINDKSATLNAVAQTPYKETMDNIDKTWAETNDKTATLSTAVKNTNASAMENVQNVWQTVEDKTVTLKATVKDANPKVMESIKSAWDSISDKTATLTAKVVDAMSSTRTKMLEAWEKLTTKTSTLTAKASNSSSSVFASLTSIWDKLVSKSVTITAYGSTASSVGNAQAAFNSLYNKSVTISVYGSLTQSFYSAKSAYDAMTSKTITVTTRSGTVVGGGARENGGVFYGGKWHDVAGYARGGNPKSARLFYANENGMPELIGRIGANAAVMNNGQIVSSVASGVYRAVSAAMGGLGAYFANIATGISRIPEALSNITPVQPQPIMVGANGPSTYEMDMSVFNRPKYDCANGGEEDKEDMINTINAAAQRIITAIVENGGDLIVDGDRLGSRTTNVQNRQTRMYGRSVLYT